MAITGGGSAEEVQVAINGDATGLNEAANSALDSLGSLRHAAGLASAALVGLGTAGLAAAANSAAAFEEQMVEVQKVTNPETAERMGDAIQRMASRMPVAQKELAGITAQAGRFGIEGVKNIKQFTETVSKMAISTDLSTSQAGESMARLSTLMDTPISKVGDMGNIVNELSNTMSTSSAEITDAALRSSGTLSQLGASSEDIFALNAAMNSASESSERAGTRLRRMAQEIQDPKKVEDLSTALGLSADEFATMREEAPVGLFRRMASTMGEGGEAADALRSTLSTTSQQALTALAQNMDGLTEAQKTANEQMENGTSLQEEYEAASSTFRSELQVVRNQLRNVAIQIGENVLPVLSDLLSRFSDAVSSFSSLNKESGGLVGTLGLVGTTILGIAGSVAWLATGPIGILAGAVATLAAAFAADFGGMQDVVDDTVAFIGESLAVADEVLEDFAEAFGATGVTITTLRDRIEDAVAGAVDVIEGLLQTGTQVLRRFRVYWEANGEAIAESVADTYFSIQDQVGRVLSFIQDSIIGPFLDAVSSVWARRGDALVSDTERTWNVVLSRIQTAVGLIQSVVEVALTHLGQFWDSHGDQILRVVRTAFDTIATVVGAVLDTVVRLARVGLAIVRGDFDEAWGIIRSIVSDAMDFVAGAVRSGLSRIVRFVSGIGRDDIYDAFYAVGRGVRLAVLTFLDIGGEVWNAFTGFINGIVVYIESGQAYRDIKSAFEALMDGVAAAIDAAVAVGGAIFGIFRDFVKDIVTYIESGQAYRDIKGAFQTLIDGIMTVFEGLYDGLIGNSLIREMIADIASFLKNAGKTAVKDAAQIMVDAVEAVFTAISFDIDWPEPPDIVEKAFNGNLDIDWPDPPDYFGGSGGGDDDDGGGAAPASGAYNSDARAGLVSEGDVVGLSTGGMIEDAGAAILHEGERVVPSAQVSDRGEVTVGGELDVTVRFEGESILVDEARDQAEVVVEQKFTERGEQIERLQGRGQL